MSTTSVIGFEAQVVSWLDAISIIPPEHQASSALFRLAIGGILRQVITCYEESGRYVLLTQALLKGAQINRIHGNGTVPEAIFAELQNHLKLGERVIHEAPADSDGQIRPMCARA